MNRSTSWHLLVFLWWTWSWCNELPFNKNFEILVRVSNWIFPKRPLSYWTSTTLPAATFQWLLIYSAGTDFTSIQISIYTKQRTNNISYHQNLCLAHDQVHQICAKQKLLWLWTSSTDPKTRNKGAGSPEKNLRLMGTPWLHLLQNTLTACSFSCVDNSGSSLFRKGCMTYVVLFNLVVCCICFSERRIQSGFVRNLETKPCVKHFSNKKKEPPWAEWFCQSSFNPGNPVKHSHSQRGTRNCTRHALIIWYSKTLVLQQRPLLWKLQGW